ncbi:MAG TPA: carbohydrate kinase family protein [Ktedonobacterales bacterium]|jgi:sugar/nucleoside kinase (ribokinase family)|nr:carbohydrate kinase family protein [Ktedonobacterales bacterium]
MTNDAIIVAGHCCLDIIPSFSSTADGELHPGKLVDVGPAVLAPGGTVSNVGLSLSRLGAPVRMVGKVGDDHFGRVLLALYRERDPALADGMIVTPGEVTSYSVVISPPGSDRIFLHCSGANHTFSAADLLAQSFEGASMLHFGYPPLMRGMYRDGGADLATILREGRRRGLFTSLDMALPDPASEAGQVDWRALLQQVLPFVDAFLPSIEETLFMLDRARYDQLRAQHGVAGVIEGMDAALLARLADDLLSWGTRIVGLKLGDQGFYLRTAQDVSGAFLLNPTDWADRELLVPCFQTVVAGTTGAGDATIAGLLTALLAGIAPEAAIRSAVAVGAYSVEHVDATSSVPSWDVAQSRLQTDWATCPVRLSMAGWRWDGMAKVWFGPHDRARGGMV